MIRLSLALIVERQSILLGVPDMNFRTLGFSIVGLFVAASATAGQESLPAYQGDPDTYKVIFEDQNFRVISATWKKGATDKPHSHPLPFVVYPVTDCTLRLHNADGSTRDSPSKAGTVFPGPITVSHFAENISNSDCQAIFVERK
jgi:hypothetical protein